MKKQTNQNKNIYKQTRITQLEKQYHINHWGGLMKLTLAEPKYLKESVSIISDLVNEGSFRITPEYIELIAIDPANVAMVLFKLLSSSFVEYEVKEEQTIGLNLGSLKQVLKRAKPSDLITLEVDDGKFNITIQGATKRRFSLPIIDIEEKSQKIPELSFTAKITCDASTLNEGIEDVSIVADSVSFIAEKDKFTILASGDLNKASVEIKQDEKTKIITEEARVKAKYSIEYLKKMVVGGKLSDTAIIEFSKDYPLKLTYKEIDKVSLSFILAPRVEND